eukprot:gb/GECG01016084.1/.p1 GENE.gb/GECG01016084.1/~~gb/GECG01016084.1/.p1  ORF type:complete len:955 (+),score=173.64 gb/GECG01016084.1/:1-2865(+)
MKMSSQHEHYQRLQQQQQYFMRMQQQQQPFPRQFPTGQPRAPYQGFHMPPRGQPLMPRPGFQPQIPQQPQYPPHLRALQQQQQQQRAQQMYNAQQQQQYRPQSMQPPGPANYQQQYQQPQQVFQMPTTGKSGKKIQPWETPHSLDLPTKEELRSTQTLRQYIDEVAPLETNEQMERRDQVIRGLEDIFKQWVKETALEKEIFSSVEAADEAGRGKLYISGSYRLNVNTPGADIDCVCVAPRYCSREDFFGNLAPKLEEDPRVAEVQSISNAVVPIIALMFDDINIDLLFAAVDQNEVTDDFDILDDQVLRNVDRATVLSLNGPRVTELITKLVPYYDTFKLVLRSLRYWFKKRGIYSNKMGFLGGVNIAIMSAYICQLYPRLSAAGVLLRFFHIFSERAWPQPVLLCTPYEDPELQLEIWDPRKPHKHARDVMPIITPAYPCANSAYNVSRSTLAVMQREFIRGRYITNAILKTHLSRNSSPSVFDWKPLFYPVEFFTEFDWYLAIDAWVDAERQKEDYPNWKGYIESRIRKLVEQIEREHLPLDFVYNFPEGFEETKDVDIEEEVPQDPGSDTQQDGENTLPNENTDEDDTKNEQAPVEDTREQNEHENGQQEEGENYDTNMEDNERCDTQPEQTLEGHPGDVRNGDTEDADETNENTEEGGPSEEQSNTTKRKVTVQQKTISFYIAFSPDMHSIRGNTLDLRKAVRSFKDAVIAPYRHFHEGMHLRERVLKWKDLPNSVFAPYGRDYANLLREKVKESQKENGKSWKLLRSRKAMNASFTWRRSAAVEDKKYDKALDLGELMLSNNMGSLVKSGGAAGLGAGDSGGGLQLPGLSSTATPGLSLSLGTRAKRHREDTGRPGGERRENEEGDGAEAQAENTQTKLIRKSRGDRASRNSGISMRLHDALKQARWEADSNMNMNSANVSSENMEQEYDQVEDPSRSFQTKLLPEEG